MSIKTVSLGDISSSTEPFFCKKVVALDLRKLIRFFALFGPTPFIFDSPLSSSLQIIEKSEAASTCPNIPMARAGPIFGHSTNILNASFS